jgi:hypothetical protein
LQELKKAQRASIEATLKHFTEKNQKVSVNYKVGA